VPDQEKQPVKIAFPPKLLGGVYANHMVVGRGKEEFILDFMLLAPPGGTVTARVVTSPRHMKRIISALQLKMSEYEKKFGQIEPAEEPKATIGFAPMAN
jgi:hypothetical protein